MIARAEAGVRRLFRLHRPGRNLAVFPGDRFIVSYPKSGNTWTRFLIGNLIGGEEQATFANINRLVPDLEELSVRELSRLRRPRILKSHQYFDPRYPRVIYVVRDPRDVALSQYHFQIKRRVLADNHPLEDFVTRFVRHAASTYGSWGENASSWIATRFGGPEFLLVRYEDLLADTVGELRRIAVFLGVQPDAETLSRAAERSSATEMRKLEIRQSDLWSSTQATRKDIPFVRVATAGGWKSKLPEKSVFEIENAWGPLMEWLGYDLLLRTPPGTARMPELILRGASR